MSRLEIIILLVVLLCLFFIHQCQLYNQHITALELGGKFHGLKQIYITCSHLMGFKCKQSKLTYETEESSISRTLYHVSNADYIYKILVGRINACTHSCIMLKNLFFFVQLSCIYLQLWMEILLVTVF